MYIHINSNNFVRPFLLCPCLCFIYILTFSLPIPIYTSSFSFCTHSSLCTIASVSHIIVFIAHSCLPCTHNSHIALFSYPLHIYIVDNSSRTRNTTCSSFTHAYMSVILPSSLSSHLRDVTPDCEWFSQSLQSSWRLCCHHPQSVRVCVCVCVCV